MRSADLENPTLEPNIKWIGLPVAEIWPFENIFFEIERSVVNILLTLLLFTTLGT